MRFSVKQKILSFSDSFVIRDENNRPVYQVVGKLFALGNKLRIYDMNNQEQVYIEQELFRLPREYNLFRNGERLAVVRQEYTLFKVRFNITSRTSFYTVEGNFSGYNFRILKEGSVVAKVNKAFFAFTDTYSVDILAGEDEAFLLAVCIVIDQTLHDNNN